MSTALDVLEAARSQIGFVEGPNNDSPYGEWYGLNHNPYCAMGVSWCFNEAGLVSLVAAQSKKGFASCTAGLSWFQKNGQIVGKYNGQPGDIVFFNFSGNGVAEHVELLEAASKDGITTIGFNTSPDHLLKGSQANGGGCYRRHRPYLNVMAIARPKYPTVVKPATSISQNKGVAAGVAGATALGGGGAAVLNNNSSDTTKPTTVISAPAFPGSGSFKIGASNQAVLAIEQGLVKVKLLTLADKNYTAETQAAVVAYQSTHKLTPDGIVGPKTYKAITDEAKK